jgi:hypothetical protein
MQGSNLDGVRRVEQPKKPKYIDLGELYRHGKDR